MIKIAFTEEDIKALNYERYHHPHPRVQQKMETLWLKSQGEPHNKIAKLTGVSINVVTRYIKEYRDGGIEKLKEINFYRPESKLSEHKQTIENYFRKHPPATMKEAMGVIEELTGLKRSEIQVAKFLKKIGLRRRKVGTIPSKADVDEQEAFKKNAGTPSQRSRRREKNRILY
jgi:transposase